jgi:hemin uptake protein HemP
VSSAEESNAPARAPVPTSPERGAAAPAPAAAASPRQPIDSTWLFGGAKEVQIAHGRVLYRLQQTALGKLILIK